MATPPSNVTPEGAPGQSEAPEALSERLVNAAQPPIGHYVVRSCDGDAAVVEAQASFVHDGLRRGEAVVAIVASDQRRAIERRLLDDGVDVVATRSNSQLIFADCERILTQTAARAGRIQWPAFRQAMCGAMRLASSGRALRTTSELVNVLSSERNFDAALQVEEFWFELLAAQISPVTVLCAYDASLFTEHPQHLHRLRAIYSREAHVSDDGMATAPQSGKVHLREHDTPVPEPRASARQPWSNRERLLDTIADTLPALIAYIDRDHRYRFVNAEYERWWGVSKDALLGRRVAELVGHEVYEQLRDPLAIAFSGSTVEFQAEVDTPAFGKRFADITYVPQRDDRGHIEGVAALVSDMTLRRRLERERQQSAERSRRLVTITAALSAALDLQQVFRALDQVSAAVNASSTGLFRVSEDGLFVHLIHSSGYSEHSRSRLAELNLQAQPSIPALDAIRTSCAVWIQSQQELLAAYPHLASIVTQGRNYQVAALPVVAHDRTWGSLGFTFDNQPTLDEQRRDFMMLVAGYCGQALERLRLLEAERRARAAAEAAAARADLLSDASRAFSEARPSMTDILEIVTRRVTASHAELCSISLASVDSLEMVAAHHRDPEAEAALRELMARALPRSSETASARVLTTGQSLLVHTVDRDELLANSPAEYVPWLGRWTPGSIIIVPLRSRDGIVGTLTAARGVDGPPFTQADVRFLEDLGERAAMAIDNARLYQENEHARRRTEHLYSLARIVMSARDVQEVFAAALDGLERAVATPRAAILTFDEQGVMRFRAARGLSPEYRAAVEGHSPWTRDASDPKPILIADTLSEPSLSQFAALFAREHIAALGFIPLLAGNELVGKFMVYYDAPRGLLQHELDMAQAIANHVGSAVARFTAIDDLQKTIRFNEMFMGMLGHDLRNPLWAIITGAEVARAYSTTEQAARALTRIVSSGQRMARMIDQLLDFTRVRVGRGIPIRPASLDLVPLVQQVVDELASASPDCSLVLTLSGDTVGHWDADRLSQVFSNLIANAIQHGTGERVEVRLDGTNAEQLRGTVRNDGVIPEALLPALFEPMVSGERTRRPSQGLGLGLYISQQIVRAHGGNIEVRSRPTDGTQLTVILPREAARESNA